MAVVVNSDFHVQFNRLCATQKVLHLKCCRSHWEVFSCYFHASLSFWYSHYAFVGSLKGVSHFSEALSILMQLVSHVYSMNNLYPSIFKFSDCLFFQFKSAAEPF